MIAIWSQNDDDDDDDHLDHDNVINGDDDDDDSNITSQVIKFVLPLHETLFFYKCPETCETHFHSMNYNLIK